MYLCICNNVREQDKDKYHLIGTQCGKCVALIDKSQLLQNGQTNPVEKFSPPEFQLNNNVNVKPI